MATDDPFSILGLSRAATLADIADARRRLAKRAHPDVGGSAEQMQRINDAAVAASEAVTTGTPEPTAGRGGRSPAGRSSAASVARSMRRYGPPSITQDHPSFVIEATPDEAFVALRSVLDAMGDVDAIFPPDRIDAILTGARPGRIVVEMTPEAGAVTVGLTFAAAAGYPPESIDAVRDDVIAELNAIDWNEL